MQGVYCCSCQFSAKFSKSQKILSFLLSSRKASTNPFDSCQSATSRDLVNSLNNILGQNLAFYANRQQLIMIHDFIDGFEFIGIRLTDKLSNTRLSRFDKNIPVRQYNPYPKEYPAIIAIVSRFLIILRFSRIAIKDIITAEVADRIITPLDVVNR